MPDNARPAPAPRPLAPSRPRTKMLLGASVLATAVVIIVVLAVALTSRRAPAPSGPAGVVQQALDLRRDRVGDAKRYDPLFADKTIGAQLAKDSEAATVAPIPAWSPPYISEEASASAKVVVVWTASEEPRFKDWPKATVFALEFQKNAWLIVDAETATGTVPPAK
jgi:hypothetical protein